MCPAGRLFGCVGCSGAVVGVIDGDTIDVLVENRPVCVRLAQIDAPERTQAFGTRSRQALSAMVFRQAVTVAEAGPDRYGRTLGTVFVAGVNVNAAMIDQGMAWAYRQYVTDHIPTAASLGDRSRRRRRICCHHHRAYALEHRKAGAARLLQRFPLN